MKVSQSKFERLLRQACDEKEKFKRDLVHQDENKPFTYSAGDLASMHGETEFARAYREGIETKEEKKYAIAYASKALAKLRPIMLSSVVASKAAKAIKKVRLAAIKGNDNGDVSVISVDTQYDIPSVVASKAAPSLELIDAELLAVQSLHKICDVFRNDIKKIVHHDFYHRFVELSHEMVADALENLKTK
jgi:hypothetical protein